LDDNRIQIISKSVRLSGGEDAEQLVMVHWWVLGQDSLAAKHKKMHLRQMEVALKAKQALEDEHVTSHQTTQIAPPAHSSGQLNNGMVQDESAVNSVDHSHRDNFIATQPSSPGRMTVAPPPSPAIAVSVHPPHPSVQHTVRPPTTMPLNDAPATSGDDNQSDSDDPTLGSCIPNELGTPHVEPPLEIEEPDHTADARILKHIGHHCRGDPMEDLDFPDEPPPSDASHFAGRHMEM
jgi:hypothetical protein